MRPGPGITALRGRGAGESPKAWMAHASAHASSGTRRQEKVGRIDRRAAKVGQDDPVERFGPPGLTCPRARALPSPKAHCAQTLHEPGGTGIA